MTGFADLVTQAQPAIADGGAPAAATEARTWKWVITGWVDNTGTAISFSGVTGTCKVWQVNPDETVTVVATLTVALSSGTVTISLDKATTTGLGGGESDGRKCVWGLSLDDGTNAVQVWGPSNSPFVIYDQEANPA